MRRRDFVGTLLTVGAGCAHLRAERKRRLFFTSAGKTCSIHSDGSGFQVLEFDIPNQATWQPGPFFSDGRRVIFLSMEPRRDGPGRPFEEYYTQTPTHLWVYDLQTKTLAEIANKDRLAVFYTPQGLINDERMLVQVVRNKVGQVFNMNLDGTDAREFTKAGEGLPYGFSVSPSGRRIAFHLASPQGYQIWTSDPDGGNRRLAAAHPDHLFFGPTWAADGARLAFLDCLYKSDPGHEAADICVVPSHRDANSPESARDRIAITSGQQHWFGATYGNPKRRGGGSNMPSWTRGGEILFSRLTPGARVAWEFQASRPDVDHFNRDWKPDLARGGTEICRVNPVTGITTALTQSTPPSWNFRASESPDGRLIAFCRCETGEMPGLWVMNSDGTNARPLTRGINNEGADHPRWLPFPSA